MTPEVDEKLEALWDEWSITADGHTAIMRDACSEIRNFSYLPKLFAEACNKSLLAEREKMLNFIRDIGNFANGEGDAGNIIARRCRAMLAEAEGDTA